METCPNCRRNFPDGALLNVFISKNNNYTQELLCKECGHKAVQGMNSMMIKPKREESRYDSIIDKRDEDILRKTAIIEKKKWWQFWK